MKFSLVTRVAGITAVAALGLAACGSNNSGGGGGGGSALNAQGSTFQQTLEEEWAAKNTAGVKVTYTGNGSSTGITQFTAGKVSFAGSDVTMTSQEQSQATSACGSTALTLPITSGGVAIIYNLQGVSNLKLDAPTIANIFEGKITTWNNPAIAALNPGTKLPSTAITPVHRADGSGTTDVLSGYLDAVAPNDWTLGVNKLLNWPSGAGQAATGSSGVTQTVKSTNGGITYAEITYAQQDNLPTASVKSSSGGGYQTISSNSVAQSINSGFSVTSGNPQNSLAGSLSFTKMTGYPISTVSYVLACSKYKSSATGTAVKKYLTYAAGDGQSLSDSLGFAPLPSSLDSMVKTSVATIS